MQLQENQEINKREIKWMSYEIGGKRVSSILVVAMIGGTFLFGARWSWAMFNTNYCWKCFLPTVILSSTVGLAIVAIINEVIQFLLVVKK